MKNILAILIALAQVLIPATGQAQTIETRIGNLVVTGTSIFATPSVFTGMTTGAVPVIGLSAVGQLGSDWANFKYSTASGPRLQVGSTGSNSGVAMGYAGASGTSGISLSTTTLTTSSSHLLMDGQNVYLQGNTAVWIRPGAGSKMDFQATAGQGPSITAGTATSAVSALSITQTWNYATTPITGILANFTNTSSHANTLLMDLQVGGVTKFNVDKTGVATSAGLSSIGNNYNLFDGTSGISVKNTASIGFSTDPLNVAKRTNISDIGAASLAIGNGTVADFSGRLKLTSVTHAGVAIASLNGSPTTGEIQSVTDALVPVLGATVVAGGAAKALVWWNGANWTVVGI